jgi:hypothetical protein
MHVFLKSVHMGVCLLIRYLAYAIIIARRLRRSHIWDKYKDITNDWNCEVSTVT